jgi:hypothetical protein
LPLFVDELPEEDEDDEDEELLVDLVPVLLFELELLLSDPLKIDLSTFPVSLELFVLFTGVLYVFTAGTFVGLFAWPS